MTATRNGWLALASCLLQVLRSSWLFGDWPSAITLFLVSGFNWNNANDNDYGENEWLVVARQILDAAQQSSSNDGASIAEGGVGGEATNVDSLAEGEAF